MLFWTHSRSQTNHTKLNTFIWNLKLVMYTSSVAKIAAEQWSRKFLFVWKKKWWWWRRMSDVLSLFFVFQRPWHTDRVGCLFAVLCPSKRPWHGGRDWCLSAVLRPSKKPWQLLFSLSFYSSFWTLPVQMRNWAAKKDEHSDKCLRSGDQGWRITATLAIKPGSGLSLIFNKLWCTHSTTDSHNQSRF